MEEDVYGNVTFDGMKKVVVIFNGRSSFIEIFARACDELHCNSNELDILIEGLLHYGKSGKLFRRLISISSQDEWEKFVKIVMKNEFNVWIWLCESCPLIQSDMDIHPLEGFIQN